MIALTTKSAEVGEYGDLRCPNCRANILTPPGMQTKPGIGKCSNCKNEFHVTRKIADLANKIYDREV